MLFVLLFLLTLSVAPAWSMTSSQKARTRLQEERRDRSARIIENAQKLHDLFKQSAGSPLNKFGTPEFAEEIAKEKESLAAMPSPVATEAAKPAAKAPTQDAEESSDEDEGNEEGDTDISSLFDESDTEQALPATPEKKAPGIVAPAAALATQEAAPLALDAGPAVPVSPALQQFINNFTRAARASSSGIGLESALYAELTAQDQSIETALNLFFNAWATALYGTSQTLVNNVQTELSGGSSGWVGGFAYSCYSPAWRAEIEQQARNQLANDIKVQIQGAAERAGIAAQKLQQNNTESIKKVIAAISNRLLAHNAATHAPLAHQFVALAEQQQRSTASKIGRFIVMNRKKAAVVAVGLMLAVGYIWRRRRQEYSY